jgi:hypothetical protein
VIAVRVERLQAISEEDTEREGIDPETNQDWAKAEHFLIGGATVQGGSPERFAFSCLWDSINGRRPGCSWDDNPWVWVVSFKTVDVGR